MANNIQRITGMATGMDTDSTVKALMQPYQNQLDKMKQDQQRILWKQDAYRDVIGSMNTFKSSFFDILKPDSYVLSSNSYANFGITSNDAGTSNPSTSVKITAGNGAVAGNYSVDFTNGKLAAGAGVTSNASITTGGNTAAATTKLSDLGITTTKISLAYTDSNGNVQSPDITIDPSNMTLSDLAKAINTATSSNVSARYSELTGRFTIQDAKTGANTTLNITDASVDSNGNTFNGKLLETLNIAAQNQVSVDQADATYGIAPSDLTVKITPPGGVPTTVTKPSNTFLADGITYSFTAAKSADVSVTADTQKTFDKIKGFIDKYNDMVDQLSAKINEKSDSSYPPLTDDQKKSMSQTDITNWETKAKVGLLGNDSDLQNMLDSMRQAFYTAVSGAGISLGDIGLSTSSDITQNGKIFIDETKLKDAIQNRGDQVASIFSKTSTSQPIYWRDLTSSQRKTRYNEEGIFQRINDIMADYTTTSRNKNGSKGVLVDQAGIKGDFTEYNNLMTTDVQARQKAIDDMVQRMTDKQNAYYDQFAKMETAVNSYNQQSSWLTQQISKGL